MSLTLLKKDPISHSNYPKGVWSLYEVLKMSLTLLKKNPVSHYNSSMGAWFLLNSIQNESNSIEERFNFTHSNHSGLWTLLNSNQNEDPISPDNYSMEARFLLNITRMGLTPSTGKMMTSNLTSRVKFHKV